MVKSLRVLLIFGSENTTSLPYPRFEIGNNNKKARHKKIRIGVSLVKCLEWIVLCEADTLKILSRHTILPSIQATLNQDGRRIHR